MKIKNMTNNELATQIELMAKEIKARESSIKCDGVFYDVNWGFYVKHGDTKMFEHKGGVQCGRWNMDDIPCKWIETTRENIKVGDIVNFATTRGDIKTYESRIVMCISDRRFTTQFIDDRGGVNCSRGLSADKSFLEQTCFIARTEKAIK